MDDAPIQPYDVRMPVQLDLGPTLGVWWKGVCWCETSGYPVRMLTNFNCQYKYDVHKKKVKIDGAVRRHIGSGSLFQRFVVHFDQPTEGMTMLDLKLQR